LLLKRGRLIISNKNRASLSVYIIVSTF